MSDIVSFTRLKELPAQIVPGRFYLIKADDEDTASIFVGSEAGVAVPCGSSGGGTPRDWSIHYVGTVSPKTYTHLYAAMSERVLSGITLGTSAGTCKVTVTIDGVPVEGLDGITATTTKTSYVATGANTIPVGGELGVIISDVVGAQNLKYTLG